jgi:hypothetical protein
MEISQIAEACPFNERSSREMALSEHSCKTLRCRNVTRKLGSSKPIATFRKVLNSGMMA